jgi:alpha-L-rhamnosidase
MGYGGDAHATTATALDHYALGAFYTKWAEDWRDVQGKEAAWGVGKKEGEAGAVGRVESGNLPYTAPTYWGGSGPGWSGYCVTLPWELYQRYGDRRILEDMFPTIERWLAFLETKSQDDLLRRYGGEWDFLGDWLWPGAEGVNGDTRETLCFNNCYWVYNLATAARIAEALGRKDAAAKWSARAQAVRAAIHREFFNAADASYVNGFQAYLSLALVADVPPAELRAAVAKRLEAEILVRRQGHFWAGITGGSFVVRQLIEADRNDLLYTMATKEDYPGWGYMLKNGASTLWEDWEGKLSRSHSSYLHLGAWFVEGLAGIRPGADGQGYQNFIIKPGVWPGCPLEWAKCRFDSPYGPIRSDWRLTGNELALTVEVPPNTTATALLPAKDIPSVSLDGKKLKPGKDVNLVTENGTTKVAVKLPAGRYELRAPRP